MPAAEYTGPASFEYTVDDGNGRTDTGTVSITVYERPVAPVAVDDAKSAIEDTPLVFAAAQLIANDTDANGDVLTVTSVTATAETHGTVVLINGDVTYTPEANYNGSGSFEYTISDGNAGTDNATVSLTIDPVNDSPTGISPAAVITEAGVGVGITLGGSDVETPSGSLTYIIETAPQHGTVVVVGNVATYTPKAGYAGDDSFAFTVTDGGDPTGSHGNPSDLTSSPATVDVEVGARVDLVGSMTYTDSVGNEVTVTLTGPGVGVMYFASEGNADLLRLELGGTTTASSLTITVTGPTGETTVWTITVNGSLGDLRAGDVNLLGHLTATGSMNSVTLNDVADQHIIAVGPSADPNAKVSFTFDEVTDLIINSAIGISGITATTWTDTDATPDAVNAPFLGGLTIAEDFEADLVLSGAGATGDTLGMVRIGRNLTGADWDVSGTTAMMMISGVITNWTLHSSAGLLTGTGMMMLGEVVSGSVLVDNGNLGMIMALRWATGNLRGNAASMIMIQGRAANAWLGTAAINADLGANITLSGAGVTFGSTLGMVMLASSGTLSGVWDITGGVGMVLAGGTVNNWTLGVANRLTAVSMLMLGDIVNATMTVNGVLGMVMATRLAAGAIVAHSMTMLMLQGKAANAWAGRPAIAADCGADITLSGAGVTFGSTLGMVMLASGGTLSGVWDITGGLGMVMASGTVSNWTLGVANRLTGVSMLMLGTVLNSTAAINGTLGMMMVSDGVTGCQWTVLGLLRMLMVTGIVRNSTFRTTEDMSMVMIGASEGSDFLAGMANNGKRHATVVGDYAGDSEIGMFMVRGVAGLARSFVDSSLSAAAIGMVMLANPEWDNGGNGVNAGEEFGLFARDEIRMAMITDSADPSRNLTLMGFAGWTDTTVEDFHADTLWRDPNVVPPGATPETMTLMNLKNQAAELGLGAWAGDSSLLAPGLMASFGDCGDPNYVYVKDRAYVYDNALAITAFLMGKQADLLDDESLARAFQIADALVLIQDNDPINAARLADGEFPALTPAPIQDLYDHGPVATDRNGAGLDIRAWPGGDGRTSSGNQAYVAMALLLASDVASQLGETDRAADYLRTAKEMLLYVGRTRLVADALGGFRLADAADIPTYPNARATEHNIDLAWAFDRLAQIESNGALKTRWQEWRDAARAFCNLMYDTNPRLATLDWISDDWSYFHAGADSAGNIDNDLVPLDVGAWSALALGDYRDMAFGFLQFLSTSTDRNGRTYTGFDPGFRAVSDESLTSRRDGVGSEMTAYMAIVARELGDTAVLEALAARASLTASEQAAYDTIVAAANAGSTDHDLADFILAQLADIQQYALDGDGLGLVAAPTEGVGTGEYDLISGWALASTCWARFAFHGWNMYSEATVDQKVFDDGSRAVWLRGSPDGVGERAVPVYIDGQCAGFYRAIELSDHVDGTGQWPLTWSDIVANTYHRAMYLKPDGSGARAGTSVVGSVSARLAGGELAYIPRVTRVNLAVDAGGVTTIETVAAFADAAEVVCTLTAPKQVAGQTVSDMDISITTLQDTALDAAELGSDAFRLLTLSSMFSDSTQYDASMLRYEDDQGQVQTLGLTDATQRDAHLWTQGQALGSWFELVKEPGSAYFPDSPTVRVDILDVTDLAGRLGIQGWLSASTLVSDDSLTVWPEWLDAPTTIAAGTTVSASFRITATAP